MHPEQKKITVKLWAPLLELFTTRQRSCFINRDAFLNHLLTVELDHLAADMKGKKVSEKARRYIARTLRNLEGGTKTINIVVDGPISEKLGKIVAETNLVRDAFFNRMILLMCTGNKLLKGLHLPTDTRHELYDDTGFQLSTVPMVAFIEVLADPLWFLRDACQKVHEEGLYSLQLGPRYDGFSCWLDDAAVPNSRENKRFLKALDVTEAEEKVSELGK